MTVTECGKTWKSFNPPEDPCARRSTTPSWKLLKHLVNEKRKDAVLAKLTCCLVNGLDELAMAIDDNKVKCQVFGHNHKEHRSK